jgi:nicotinate-nucleotide adenylyltransferase
MNKLDLKKFKKVGVFGGSFDPVTKAHITIAELVFNQYNLDHVLFLPNFQNPLKEKTHTKPEVRVKLLELALTSKENFSICKIEIDANKACYTYDTIQQLKNLLAENAEIYFIHGSDCLDNLSSWYRIDELLASVNFVIVGRSADFNEQLLKTKLKNFKSFQIERLLKYAMFIEPILVSSSDVRKRIENNEAYEEFLDPLVLKFIQASHLYGIS